jgi:hypothetical protein
VSTRIPVSPDPGPVPHLHASVERLAFEFDGVVPLREVREVVFGCYDNLVDSGAPAGALPELVERSARERLRQVGRPDLLT